MNRGSASEIRFGIIGLGLMGREFASAAARWLHLQEIGVRPVITAVCDPIESARDWFLRNVPTVRRDYSDYRDLLEDPEVDAVYCAVPHHLHESVYCEILRSGKHLLGEKPFGIDLEANERINEEIRRHPELLVRCSSEFPFYPGAYRIARSIAAGEFGRIIGVEAGFLHSSDLDPRKPINWKRRIETNGAYGCMGDLGMHVLHIPLRAGWMPDDVSAQLSNIVPQRPDGRGGTAACDTWDNATILGRVPQEDAAFPLLLHTKRIAPGETNTWYLKVHGTELSMEYSTKFPKTLRRLQYRSGGEQAWQHLDLGYESAYPAITGGIFEFGFPDAILQMWAAFCDELAHGREGMKQPFTCVTPEEAAQSHIVFTRALESGAA
ncbi:MAG TPA: Gfo/Idh/MocA family oxidoreductase [Trueperaceae bacterium]